MTLTTDPHTTDGPSIDTTSTDPGLPTPAQLPVPRPGTDPSDPLTARPQPDDDLDIAQLLRISGRQADELAAITEHALTAEHTAHRAQIAELDRLRADLDHHHQRRVALLTLLAEHLGQINQQLDEAGHLARP